MAVQTTTAGDAAPVPDDRFSEKHKVLKLRLAPLRGIQTDLERKLGSGALEDHGQLNNNGRGPAQSASAVNGSLDTTESPPVEGDDSPIRRLPNEFYIRSNNSWKDRLKTGLRNATRPHSGGSLRETFTNWSIGEKETPLGEWGKANVDVEEITGIIARCREDIKALWEDELVQKVLSRRKYRVDESSGLCVIPFLLSLQVRKLTLSNTDLITYYGIRIHALFPDSVICLPTHSFLNDVDRIATKNYRPSDDDVVRARLRTLGVQEHHFVFEEGTCASITA